MDGRVPVVEGGNTAVLTLPIGVLGGRLCVCVCVCVLNSSVLHVQWNLSIVDTLGT